MSEPTPDPRPADGSVPASPPSTRLVPAVCTRCGGNLKVDPAEEAAVCDFCRTPFIVEKAIAQYQSQLTVLHADTVVQDAENVHIRQSGIASVVGLVERQINRRQEQADAEARKAEEAAERERQEIAAMPPLLRFFKKNAMWVFPAFALVLCIVGLSVGMASEANGARPDESGFITVPSSSTLEGDNYNAVLEELRDRGFTNIEAEPLGDLITGWIDKPDEVDKVTVAGNPDYSSSKRYPKNVEIVVYYHSFPGDDEAAVAPEEPAVTTPSGEAPAAPTPSVGLSAEGVRARFLSAFDVKTELDLYDLYVVDPVAPTYAITQWELVGDWVRVYIQANMSSGEVEAAGHQVIGLTCEDFPTLAGVIVRGADGIDHNVPRRVVPFCVW